MAYAGVVSLKQTVQRLLHSSRFSLVSSTREILGSATFLQEILKRLDDRGGGGGKRLDSLDAQIREAAHKFEDVLELHESDDLFLSPTSLQVDSEQLRQEISWFAETAKKLAEDYAAELDNSSSDDDDDAVATASSSDTGLGADNMVGLSEELARMKTHVGLAVRPDDWGVLSIVGRPGTGRSYVAWMVFEYLRECRDLSFDCGVWAAVGPNYHRRAILVGILAQVLIIDDGGGDATVIDFGAGGAMVLKSDGTTISFESDEETARNALRSRLVGRRYMMVLNDVRDTQILDYLLSVFPVENNGSVVVVTTPAIGVGLYPRPFCTYWLEDLALNHVDAWWDIIRWVFFRLRPVPPELEEAGKKILRNCGGRGVSFVKAILFLWSADRTPEAWNQISHDQNHPIFQEVVDEVSEILKIKEDFANFSVEPASDRAILAPFIEDNGISVTIENTKKKLFPKRFFQKMEVISFVGMAGIGKTTFVKKIFEYKQNLHHFYPCVCVWVTLGPKYKSEEILKDILAQIHPVTEEMELKGDSDELANELSKQFSNKRFFIVLDDVWTEEPLHYLAKSVPNIKGRILLTTRISKVAHCEVIDIVREMHLLSEEESWDLLRLKVFGEGWCPRELVKSGKKIARNCDGLPLTIVKVANLLSKDLSPHYWNDVANKNSDFTNAIKELSNTLLPSYKSLPHYLKLCFLYMGVFPERDEVCTSKLFRLWISEGFLEPDLHQRVEDFAAQCLSELVDTSLVMACYKGSSYGVKTCRLNCVLWHLSNSEAVKNKFFYAFSSTTYARDSVEEIRNQRRFSIRNCILLSNQGLVMESISSATTPRSLLCSGPYHQYPLPVCFDLRLLRVLDALVIRFYEFPLEVVKLTHLRHLAITCDGELPTSISKLWNLQFLIISRHLSVKSPTRSSYMPMEIWDMKELRHLQVTGSNLLTPTCGTILPNLVTLLDVSPLSCTEEVLKAIPNLEKLGIQIELAPEDDGKPFDCLNHISINLSKLKSLKCVVVNPEVGLGVVPPPAPLSMFPSSLEKLSLSGLGYPWEYMNTICQLENLKVLKLRCYAFQGHRWDTGDYAFKKLEYLSIEDADLVCWTTTVLGFPLLKHLSIKNCYKLEELPSKNFSNTRMIEVVDCNPFVGEWVELMKRRSRKALLLTETDLKFHVECSWYDEPTSI